MMERGATREADPSPNGATSGATLEVAEQADAIPLSEAATVAEVSVQALRQRIKRGSVRGVRLVIGGRVVVGVSRHELDRVFGTTTVAEPRVAPGCSGDATPGSNPEQPAPQGGSLSAELVVMRSDYRTMLALAAQRADAAEAREVRARRALGPSLAGLAVAVALLGVAVTAWHGASVRAGELAEEVPGLRARTERLGDEALAAQLAMGEKSLALERAQLAHDLVLTEERERRQRAEALVVFPMLRDIVRRATWWGMSRRGL